MLVLTLAFLAVLPAGADAAATVTLAGGAVEKRGNTDSLVRLSAEGTQATVLVDGFVDCAGRSYIFADSETRSARFDGAGLAAAGRGHIQLGKGRIRYRWRLHATVDDQGGSGVLVTRAMRRGGRCLTLRSRFRLRTIPQDAGEPQASAPSGPYYGEMRQPSDRARGMTLRVRDGRVSARWPALARCQRGGVERFPNLTPFTRVRNGRFERRERFAVEFADDVIVRYRVRFSGRFTTTGATGIAEMSARVFQDGRRINYCPARPVRWIAVR